jgi:hypothetical protein
MGIATMRMLQLGPALSAAIAVSAADLINDRGATC